MMISLNIERRCQFFKHQLKKTLSRDDYGKLTVVNVSGTFNKRVSFCQSGTLHRAREEKSYLFFKNSIVS